MTAHGLTFWDGADERSCNHGSGHFPFLERLREFQEVVQALQQENWC